MSKTIIVAGAGHGGLTAAALLAKAGFDVTIYERNEEG
ncbi:MAG: NAD(P)-binding protein, partial [Clostridia bacterium]|nr:NAD(P)-binding protein [Clostridia bacterium]